MVEQEKTKDLKEEVVDDGIIRIRLQPAPDKYIDKKWMVTIAPYGTHKSSFKVLFGRVGYTDQLIAEDKDRRDRYIDRHDNEERFWDMKIQENLRTASYWSRYLLWNHHDIDMNIKEIEEKSGVQIQYSKAGVKKYLKQLAKVVK